MSRFAVFNPTKCNPQGKSARHDRIYERTNERTTANPGELYRYVLGSVIVERTFKTTYAPGKWTGIDSICYALIASRDFAIFQLYISGALKPRTANM